MNTFGELDVVDYYVLFWLGPSGGKLVSLETFISSTKLNILFYRVDPSFVWTEATTAPVSHEVGDAP